MKKLLLLLLLAASFSLAADTTNADAAFRDLDCEFGECASNPADPTVKEETKKDKSSTVTQDSYAPRDERDDTKNDRYKRSNDKTARYSDNYTPAQPKTGKRFYQYIGYGLFKGDLTETYSGAESGNALDEFRGSYASSRYTYGIFMPKASMKLEISYAQSHHDFLNSTNALSELNYDLLFGKATTNNFLGGFAYLRLGLVTQFYDNTGYFSTTHESDIKLGGARFGVGYSVILANLIEAYVDYTIMVSKGVQTSTSIYEDIDAAFSYSTYGYGLHILF